MLCSGSIDSTLKLWQLQAQAGGQGVLSSGQRVCSSDAPFKAALSSVGKPDINIKTQVRTFCSSSFELCHLVSIEDKTAKI